MEQQRFTGLMDMLDGGGAGAEGNEFKGGGLLSDIGNALFQPAGYRERMRGMQETRPRMRPASMSTQGAPAPMSQEDMLTQMRSQLASGNNTPTTPGPMMPGGPTPPVQAAPTSPTAGANAMTPTSVDPRQQAMMEEMTRQMSSPVSAPGPMMPGGPMPQGTPAPMSVEAAMAQLEGALNPSERQTLQSMPMEQRMGMIQRLIQMRQGGM